jgi:integrase
MLNDLSKGSIKKIALAPWTVTKAKNVMSGAMEQAMRNRIIPYNPVKATVSPKLEQKEIRVLTEGEQKQFMSALKGHRLEALFLLTLATGMRRGEVMALTWDCIDYNNMSITVKGSITRVKDPDTGVTALRYSEPKTKNGRRHIPILPSMLPILYAHKERQDTEKANVGSAWNTKNLVFCSNVGTVLEPRRINTTMQKITDAAGLPHFTFHSLRHTFATRMLEANVSAKVVQDILGHADVTLTLNTYSHVIGTTAHDQMAKIDGLFNTDKDNKPQLESKTGIKQQLALAKVESKALNKKPRDINVKSSELEL